MQNRLEPSGPAVAAAPAAFHTLLSRTLGLVRRLARGLFKARLRNVVNSLREEDLKRLDLRRDDISALAKQVWPE